MDSIGEDLVDIHEVIQLLEQERAREQEELDRAIAISLYRQELEGLGEGFAEALGEQATMGDLEGNTPLQCACCSDKLTNETRRVLPCGHLYCLPSISTICKMALRDRSMAPAHCCKIEYPAEYVTEVLSLGGLEDYVHFIEERGWRNLDIDSDREYSALIQSRGWKQCPGCGIGVERISGCHHVKCPNGHEFCFDCAVEWKSCGCPQWGH